MQNSPVVKDNTTVFGQLQSKLIVEVIDMTLEQVQPLMKDLNKNLSVSFAGVVIKFKSGLLFRSEGLS